jgi:putative transposase
MRLRDAPYPRPPVYSSRRMTAWRRGAGDAVNRTRVVRLMGAMGLEAICPRPRLRAAGLAATGYLYVLQGMEMHGPHHGWGPASMDLPMPQGFMELGGIMDWSRRVVRSWELSNTWDVGCCLVALEAALVVGQPHRFNSAHRVQCTSHAFTGRLEEAGVILSMDGAGGCLTPSSWRGGGVP